jgi:hypothetical protein
MSGEAYPGAQEKHQDTCWLCGRMLTAGYYFVCHICGATYCYSHMPEKCTHARRKPMTAVRQISPKA